MFDFIKYILFTGLNVILLEDFLYQLQLPQGREVIQQQGESIFLDLLNNFRLEIIQKLILY